MSIVPTVAIYRSESVLRGSGVPCIAAVGHGDIVLGHRLGGVVEPVVLSMVFPLTSAVGFHDDEKVDLKG